MQRIREERERQIKAEGWSAAHDDEHEECELQRAGKCYELMGDFIVERKPFLKEVTNTWPWDVKWWKPSTSAERNYEKAGALYQAEADRFSRAGKQVQAMKMEVSVERVAAKLDRPTGTAAPEGGGRK